jgi:protein-S-isoprenylcysteine O-methyltransferase Ste14
MTALICIVILTLLGFLWNHLLIKPNRPNQTTPECSQWENVIQKHYSILNDFFFLGFICMYMHDKEIACVTYK